MDKYSYIYVSCCIAFPSDSMLHTGSSEDSDPAFTKLKNPATGFLFIIASIAIWFIASDY